jgi:uncharacterized protein YbaR (Trm112 family)
MSARMLISSLLAGSLLTSAATAQDKPAAPATNPAPASSAADFNRQIPGLSSESFADREAALKRLQTLIADQIKQRAAIQEVLTAFQNDLFRQQQTLALVSDEEAQAQIAGLLEMERGLTGWTLQTMDETPARRNTLLTWGLTRENGPILARAYAERLRTRLDGIKQLAKSDADGANWTLARLLNDRQSAIRAATMALCWNRKPSDDIVNALWFRAVSGALARNDTPGIPVNQMDANMPPGLLPETVALGDAMRDNQIKIDFPGGEPLEFDDANDSGEFYDALLASDVLVHLNSPLVADKVKNLVADRAKAGKTLCHPQDLDWTLVSHRLVETYKIKDAIPLLAVEALAADSEDLGGDMNGRPFSWSARTMAIGTLAKLIDKDPAEFDLIRARNTGDARGWMWAFDANPQQMINGNGDADLKVVKAFYAFWKDHHAQYGVKEVPSDAAITQPNRGMPGFRGRPIPPVEAPPLPPAPALDTGAAPAAPAAVPPPAARGGAAG